MVPSLAARNVTETRSQHDATTRLIIEHADFTDPNLGAFLGHILTTSRPQPLPRAGMHWTPVGCRHQTSACGSPLLAKRLWGLALSQH